MRFDELEQNMIDQIKEAQLKLGYAHESIRLYFPFASLMGILYDEDPGTGSKGCDLAGTCGGEEGDPAPEQVTSELLEKELRAHYAANPSVVLGRIEVSRRGERFEFCIPPEGADHVKESVPDPVFLKALVGLFQTQHHPSLEQIQSVFEAVSPDYVCQKMPEGEEFDYVMYFTKPEIDRYYYCVRWEMGHTIYHRFLKHDVAEWLT